MQIRHEIGVPAETEKRFAIAAVWSELYE